MGWTTEARTVSEDAPSRSRWTAAGSVSSASRVSSAFIVAMRPRSSRAVWNP